jgi:site-specific DNA-cytosine methylase
MHDGTGHVDGHDVTRSPSFDRVVELCDLEPWSPGESISDVLRRYYGKHGKLPRGWYYDTKKELLDDTGQRIPVIDEEGNQAKDKRTGKPIWKTEVLPKADRLIETDFAMGHNQQVRWHGDRLANVITGGACHLVLHPSLPRTLTQREAARIQGFPDAWRIFPVRTAPDLGPGWGKGVPVHAGKWIGEWAKASLEGRPGPMTGVPLALYDKRLASKYDPMDREFVIDVTNDWKQLQHVRT